VAKLEAEMKAKAAAERQAKLEAEMKAKAAAERQAKLEAEMKAKAAAERQAKLEAEMKAKAAAERQAKLEAKLAAENAQLGKTYQYHQVKNGETILQIAAKYNVSVSDLQTLNNISTQTILRKGMELKIRKK
uniref:LysM peptidoglycan-binding domain-containing protein n=1 Tax=Aureispira sp. CCB-QB1 TaxID=1313421 RepID=UPI0012DD7C69